MVENNNKLTKEAKQALNAAINVLEHAMELAMEKEDLEAMVAISDRLMMLYQHLSDKGTKKFKMGFGIMDNAPKKRGRSEEEDDDHESD